MTGHPLNLPQSPLPCTPPEPQSLLAHLILQNTDRIPPEEDSPCLQDWTVNSVLPQTALQLADRQGRGTGPIFLGGPGPWQRGGGHQGLRFRQGLHGKVAEGRTLPKAPRARRGASPWCHSQHRCSLVENPIISARAHPHSGPTARQLGSWTLTT